MASPGTDIAFNVARTEGYRAFANKIWNAARFIFMNVDKAAEIGITVDPAALGGMPTAAADAPLEARWIVAELHSTAAKANESLESYRYDDAANAIYQFIWDRFCDSYLESIKLRLNFSESADKPKIEAALATLVSVFEATLRLLSPFMPFLTEELWHAIYDGNPPEKSIALASYPQPNGAIAESLRDYPQDQAVSVMYVIESVISTLLAQRKACGVPEREAVPARIYINEQGSRITDALWRDPGGEKRKLCEYRAKVTLELLHQLPPPAVAVRSGVGYDVEILYTRPPDVGFERERLTRDIAKYEKGVAAAERQLGNARFLAKAPSDVVSGLRKQEAETRLLLEKARLALDALPRA
jgi:valyl-tRNA synthetase